MRFWNFRRRDEPIELPPVNEERIVLIRAPESGGSDLISDSQSGEIHRVLERDKKRQIDAVPIVRRLLGRDITARNVAVLDAPADEIDVLLGLHFVLDERTRHIYRVALTPSCCRVERLWGNGLDEVHERPLGGPLFSWCDRFDSDARASISDIARVLPNSQSWGLRFVSLQTEAASEVQRRLFSCAQGQLRHHLRPGKSGIEGAIEITWQKRIVRTFEAHSSSSTCSSPRTSRLKIVSETDELPF